MNTNEISPNAASRLKRIQIVSRTIQIILAAFLIFTAWIYCRGGLVNWWHNRHHESFFQAVRSTYPYGSPLFLISTLILMAWFWNLIKLFRLYERGLIFAAQTIRVLKVLGYICIAGGIFFAVANLAAALFQEPQASSATSAASEVRYHMGFSTFDFGTGVDFGPILMGLIVLLIAWVMDEGRKIREEQELTV